MRRTILKNILGVLAMLAISSSLLEGTAQAQLIHGVKHGVATNQDVINLDSCWVPVLPNSLAPEQVIWAKSGNMIVFCMNVDGNVAATYKYQMSIDAQIPIGLDVNCYKTGVPTTCLAIIPDLSITLLQNDLKHTMHIIVRDAMNVAMLSTMDLPVRKPVCMADGLQYTATAPLPAVVNGALRNQSGSFTFETQVGKLREAGWHIEWQRVQFGIDLDGKSGYWYMLGWCEGI